MIHAMIALIIAEAGTIPGAESKQVPVGILRMVRPHSGMSRNNAAAGTIKAYGGRHDKASVQSGVPGVDSVQNFTSSFTAPGFDSFGNPQSVWPFEMVGRGPDRAGVSVIPAPIIPVAVDLLAPDGSVAVFRGHPLTLDPAVFLKPVLESPIFEAFPYLNGFTQFNDAMMRAGFADRLRGNGQDGFHTVLSPRVKGGQRMQIPFGSWFFGTNTDNTIAFALVDETAFVNALFPTTVPVDDTTVIGAAELVGDMTTRDLTTLLFNNVFLYDGAPDNCCALGFHTYDFEPGDSHNGNRERRFVFDYASWISPGLFSFGFEDITALSHEISETFNDPFVDNATPWWLSVDPFGVGGAVCQNSLETGDVIEVLSGNPVFPIQMHGRTYHPQNEAMLPWFVFQSPSSAFNGGYSFPDETTLTALSPGNLLPGCVPAPASTGQIAATWSITKTGAASTCAEVGGVTVEILTTPQGGGSTIADVFDCAAMAGTTFPVPTGTYSLQLRLLDSSGQQLSQITPAGTVSVVAGQTTNAGNFVFAL